MLKEKKLCFLITSAVRSANANVRKTLIKDEAFLEMHWKKIHLTCLVLSLLKFSVRLINLIQPSLSRIILIPCIGLDNFYKGILQKIFW